MELVRNCTNILSVLSKRDNMTIFLAAAKTSLNNSDGTDVNITNNDISLIKAEVSTAKKIGIPKKTYYTRLKQLVDVGLIAKHDGEYIHTTLGSVIYQRHIADLIDQMKNIKQFKMIDSLKNTDEFSNIEIMHFIDKVIGKNDDGNDFSSRSMLLSAAAKIEIAWTYEDMVSAIVERTEFCRNEILLATRFQNEIIINNMLRKANSGINVQVLADVIMVKNSFEKERIFEQHSDQQQQASIGNDDKNASERIKVVGNPWYPGNVSRRVAKIPFCLVIFDSKEVGIELVDSNVPSKFSGVIFIRDEKICKIMKDRYVGMWNASSSLEDVTKNNIGSEVSKRYLAKNPQLVGESQI
jgi:hypothetical protein